MSKKKELHKFQKEIVEYVVNIEDKNILIYSPTGSGKTFITANIIKERLKMNKNVEFLFVTPRVVLVSQTEDSFIEDEVDEEFEVINTLNKRFKDNKNVSIYGIDSVIKYYKRSDEKDLIIIFDECHLNIKKINQISLALNPKQIIGLTATPERGDKKALLISDKIGTNFGGAVFDIKIGKESIESLRGQKILSNYRIFIKPIKELISIKNHNSCEEIAEKDLINVFDKNHIYGDVIDTYERFGTPIHVLGFAPSIAMAKYIAQLFRSKGYDFYQIGSNLSEKACKDLLEKFAKGEIAGLVCSELLTYGYNLPTIRYIFSLKHFKSRSSFFQMFGRGLRISKNKKELIFVDHGDSISEFMTEEYPNVFKNPNLDWKSYGTYTANSFCKNNLINSCVENNLGESTKEFLNEQGIKDKEIIVELIENNTLQLTPMASCNTSYYSNIISDPNNEYNSYGYFVKYKNKIICDYYITSIYNKDGNFEGITDNIEYNNLFKSKFLNKILTESMDQYRAQGKDKSPLYNDCNNSKERGFVVDMISEINYYDKEMIELDEHLEGFIKKNFDIVKKLEKSVYKTIQECKSCKKYKQLIGDM